MRNLPMRIVDRVGAATTMAARRATAGMRGDPDYILIGAERAGTTRLFRDLRLHPQVVAPLVKEIHFYDYNHAKGPSWYHAHFPTQRQLDERAAREGRAITGEATPNYLRHPHAARWAAAELPESTKFIVTLRNPVDRAFSHWRLMSRLGHETLDFAEAIAREEERIGPDWEQMQRHPHHQARTYFRFSYVDGGRYAEQLEEWMKRVDPARILVVRTEDHYARPAEIYAEVTEFLGLRPWQPDQCSDIHATASSAPPDGVAADLRALFAPENARLADLVGRDFAWEA